VPRVLNLSNEALRDLDAIRRWHTQPGAGRAAAARMKRIRTAIRGLKAHPCRYPEGEHPDTREMPCEEHRVVYAVDPDTDDNETAGDVQVMRVFGPGLARDRL
jgi:plasmid stabilization system protein ParE